MSRQPVPRGLPPPRPHRHLMPKAKIWTDGSCIPNPGKGGWGAVVIIDDVVEELIGSHDGPETTNNRMEMLAVIEALRHLRVPTDVVVTCDSKYVVNLWGVKGPARKNADLWERLRSEMSRHYVELVWVRGHNGDRWNEHVDRLAERARLRGIKAREVVEVLDI